MTRILAIDPGQSLGWASGASGRLEWGTEDFKQRRGEDSGARWRRFEAWLECATMTFLDPEDHDVYSLKVQTIVYERASFHPFSYAAEVAGAFYALIEAHCSRHGIALEPVSPQALKTFALGKAPKRKKGDPKMDRSKDAMVRAAGIRLASTHPDQVVFQGDKVLQYSITPDEADALWCYWYAKEEPCGHDG